MLEDEVSRALLLEAVGLEAGDDRALAHALTASDDPAVRAETDRQRRILATALANAANVMNPAVIVLGGFLAILADLDLPGWTRRRPSARRRCPRAPKTCAWPPPNSARSACSSAPRRRCSRPALFPAR